MDRRSFLRSLVGIPLLAAFLKPEAVEVKVEPIEILDLDNLYNSGEIRVLPTGDAPILVEWTGAEFSSLAIGPDDTLYVGGAFVSHMAHWNGTEFEPVEFIEGAIVRWDTVPWVLPESGNNSLT